MAAAGLCCPLLDTKTQHSPLSADSFPLCESTQLWCNDYCLTGLAGLTGGFILLGDHEFNDCDKYCGWYREHPHKQEQLHVCYFIVI